MRKKPTFSKATLRKAQRAGEPGDAVVEGDQHADVQDQLLEDAVDRGRERREHDAEEADERQDRASRAPGSGTSRGSVPKTFGKTLSRAIESVIRAAGSSVVWVVATVEESTAKIIT